MFKGRVYKTAKVFFLTQNVLGEIRKKKQKWCRNMTTFLYVSEKNSLKLHWWNIFISGDFHFPLENPESKGKIFLKILNSFQNNMVYTTVQKLSKNYNL